MIGIMFTLSHQAQTVHCKPRHEGGRRKGERAGVTDRKPVPRTRLQHTGERAKEGCALGVQGACVRAAALRRPGMASEERRADTLPR